MTIIRAPDLTDLRVGWQKVADRYHMTIHIFSPQAGGYIAVTNKSQGVGMLVETIEPQTPKPPYSNHGGRFEITRMETEVKA